MTTTTTTTKLFDINSLKYVPPKTAVTFKESALIQHGSRIFEQLPPEKVQCMKSIIYGSSFHKKTKKRGRKRNYNMITVLEKDQEENEEEESGTNVPDNSRKEEEEEVNVKEDQKSKKLKTCDTPTLRGINRFLKRMVNEEHLAVFWKKVSNDYVPVHILQSIRHLTLMWQQHWVDPVGRQGTTEYWPFPATTCQKVFFAWLLSNDFLDRMKVVEEIPPEPYSNNNRVFLFEKSFRVQKPQRPNLKKFFKIQANVDARERYYRNFIEFHVKIHKINTIHSSLATSKFIIPTRKITNLHQLKYIAQNETNIKAEEKEDNENFMFSLLLSNPKTKLKIKDKKRIIHENFIVNILTRSKKTTKGLPCYLFENFDPKTHLIQRSSWRVKSQKEIESQKRLDLLSTEEQENKKEKKVVYLGSKKKKYNDEEDY